MSARKISLASALASLAIVLAVQTAANAQAPGPGNFADPNYVSGAGDPSLRIPRGAAGDLRPAMDNSYSPQPNASLPAPTSYGAPAQGGYGAPAQGGYGAPAQGGYGAPAQGNYAQPGADPNAIQDPNAVQPYPNKYQKSKKGGGGPSGVGMVVGGPVKAATTSVGVTGKAVKEVLKAIF
ncbi:MAG: hypothetical protein P4L53_24375 [Candidatus Obscuribacterales bacterium]|nr:hypothetical protein [Candidatus Obscuribacterales bacterium]